MNNEIGKIGANKVLSLHTPPYLPQTAWFTQKEWMFGGEFSNTIKKEWDDESN